MRASACRCCVDAIELREPERVPVFPMGGFFAAQLLRAQLPASSTMTVRRRRRHVPQGRRGLRLRRGFLHLRRRLPGRDVRHPRPAARELAGPRGGEGGQLPVQREGGGCSPTSTTNSSPTPRTSCCAPTCPAPLGRSPALPTPPSLFDYIELPFVASQVGGWGSPEMAEGLEKLATAGPRGRRLAAGHLPDDGQTHGVWVGPATSVAPARPRSTSSVTRCAARAK